MKAASSQLNFILLIVTLTEGADQFTWGHIEKDTTTTDWQQIAFSPPATPNPECLSLEAYNHIIEIKGLDACEPHHHVWRHLNDLSNMNWHCRENVIHVMADRYGHGSSMSQYCGCKTHMWTDNGARTGASDSAKRNLEGVNPACFNYQGCQELKQLYENDICQVHEIVWKSLENCPSDIFVEGQAIACQAVIVKKLFAKFNGSMEQYDNDVCYCYPTYGLTSVPTDCPKFGGFSLLQILGLQQNDCTTHFSIWKNLATQPVRCQNWIIDYMLDKTSNDFTCDCHDSGHGVFGRSLRKRDTSILPTCEQDAQGWKVMHSTFLSNPCHSHWYVWRHLADVHGHCRQYLINEMFAKFATTTSNCQCEAISLEPLPESTTTPQTTTTVPPHACYICNGSDCSTGGSSVRCESGKEFCMTSIIDYGKVGQIQRLIERKCASKQECDTQDQSANTLCDDLSKGGNFGVPFTCRFCCVGRDCNKSPMLKPSVESLYSYNFP